MYISYHYEQVCMYTFTTLHQLARPLYVNEWMVCCLEHHNPEGSCKTTRVKRIKHSYYLKRMHDNYYRNLTSDIFKILFEVKIIFTSEWQSTDNTSKLVYTVK